MPEKLSFFERVGNAFHALSGKTASPDVAAFITGSDVDAGGDGAKMTSPYAQSAWVYVAITRLAEKVSSIPFRISRMDDAKAKRVRALRGSSDPKHRAFVRRALGETIIESGDVVDLFERPHPTMNRQLFWEMVVTWNCLRGEFFILPLDASDSPVDLSTSAPRVQRLITLPTELFWHMVQQYDLVGWRYTGSPLLTPIPSEILLPGEVIHSRMPNPYLYWRGMSPLIVAMVAAGADFAASKYNQGYWLNNADTGLIVSAEGWPTDDQRKTILAALRERKRKAGTPDRPLFLGGGVKVEKPTLSGMETQFIENRKMNRQEIGAIYKVSDAIMGFSAATALSGGDAKKSEEQSFIENTIMPLCAHIEAAMDRVVKSFGPGFIGWFDVESLPVMQEARRGRLDAAVKATSIGVPLNDANRVYDLGFPEYPWGNIGRVPFNMVDAGATEELPGEEQAEPAPNDEKQNPFARMSKLLLDVSQMQLPAPVIKKPDTKLLWNAHVASRRKTVKLMEGKVRKVLNDFRGRTLAKLDEVHLERDARGEFLFKTGNEMAVRSLVDLIFDRHAFGDSLVAQLTNPITATLQLAGDEMNKELGIDDPWQMPPKKAKEFLAKRAQEIKGVGGTVRDQLNTSLQQGLDGGETTKELADRVRGVFNNLSANESERVARTETNMAYNDARHEAMTDAGIGYKAWLSSHGPNVREAHAMAEEATIDDPIPVDEPFEVGGEQLMYPGDDSMGASAGNIINCQCIQLAAQKVSEDDKTLTFKICGLGEMKFLKNGGVA